MRLNSDSIRDRALWRAAGFETPDFDLDAARKNSFERPAWVHFGAGNIFRALPAAGLQKLLEAGAADTGLIACEGYDGDIIDKAYLPFDNLSALVLLKADGTVEKRVIGSVARALRVDGARPADEEALREIFRSPSLQMASFTITEKGYAVKNARGDFFPWVQKDLDGEAENAASLMGRLCALLLERYRAGARPVALVSMDNCSHNGEKLRAAVLGLSKIWAEKGKLPDGFMDYISDESRVSFPWTMIDKITPRPDARVAEMLREAGFEDADTIVTEKNAYTAAFVNSEETEYLVIEDRFPAGRPPLEKAGYYMADREVVNRVERMKVTTCLNPLHTALSVLGCTLGFNSIYREMEDKELRALVERIAYKEGMPVVTDPGILSPLAFAKEVIEKRFSNPFMPDTPQRIATDTSQKLAIRYGETIKEYLKREDLRVADLKCIPFVFAAWLRYLLGLTDELKPFEPSPDPLLEQLREALHAVEIGSPETAEEAAAPLLSRKDIFGVDLYEAGLARSVINWFGRMIAGPGAVRACLGQLLSEA